MPRREDATAELQTGQELISIRPTLRHPNQIILREPKGTPEVQQAINISNAIADKYIALGNEMAQQYVQGQSKELKYSLELLREQEHMNNSIVHAEGIQRGQEEITNAVNDRLQTVGTDGLNKFAVDTANNIINSTANSITNPVVSASVRASLLQFGRHIDDATRQQERQGMFVKCKDFLIEKANATINQVVQGGVPIEMAMDVMNAAFETIPADMPDKLEVIRKVKNTINDDTFVMQGRTNPQLMLANLKNDKSYYYALGPNAPAPQAQMTVQNIALQKERHAQVAAKLNNVTFLSSLLLEDRKQLYELENKISRGEATLEQIEALPLPPKLKNEYRKMCLTVEKGLVSKAEDLSATLIYLENNGSMRGLPDESQSNYYESIGYLMPSIDGVTGKVNTMPDGTVLPCNQSLPEYIENIANSGGTVHLKGIQNQIANYVVTQTTGNAREALRVYVEKCQSGGKMILCENEAMHHDLVHAYNVMEQTNDIRAVRQIVSGTYLNIDSKTIKERKKELLESDKRFDLKKLSASAQEKIGADENGRLLIQAQQVYERAFIRCPGDKASAEYAIEYVNSWADDVLKDSQVNGPLWHTYDADCPENWHKDDIRNELVEHAIGEIRAVYSDSQARKHNMFIDIGTGFDEWGTIHGITINDRTIQKVQSHEKRNLFKAMTNSGTWETFEILFNYEGGSKYSIHILPYKEFHKTNVMSSKIGLTLYGGDGTPVMIDFKKILKSENYLKEQTSKEEMKKIRDMPVGTLAQSIGDRSPRSIAAILQAAKQAAETVRAEKWRSEDEILRDTIVERGKKLIAEEVLNKAIEELTIEE